MVLAGTETPSALPIIVQGTKYDIRNGKMHGFPSSQRPPKCKSLRSASKSL